MEEYREQTFDEERALYGKTGVKLIDCRFDGPADGESALKESRDIEVQDNVIKLSPNHTKKLSSFLKGVFCCLLKW